MIRSSTNSSPLTGRSAWDSASPATSQPTTTCARIWPTWRPCAPNRRNSRSQTTTTPPLPGWREHLDVRPDSPDLRQLAGPRIANLYRAYSGEHLWPRGLPIDRLAGSADLRFAPTVEGAPILCCQGLANGAPDIDAIHRLVFPDREFTFTPGGPIVLGPGVWCPTNSQNTLWRRPAFPFLYLPHTVSFRFTDILRGYVALRGIQALGGRLAFSRASVVQDRNPHRILRDFEQEIEVYLRAGEVIDLLESTPLEGRADADLRTMYQALAGAGIVRAEELHAVDAWLDDLAALSR